MGLYGTIFAACYDRMVAGIEKAGLTERRASLVGRAEGRVLEIGGGTGLNLAHYGPGVETLVIAEPEEPMARRLERKLAAVEAGAATRAEVARAKAEELPFDDASFDCVVSTLVLCTVDDQAKALSEIHRVLRPGGRLLFLEHVRSDEPGLARWQDRLNGIQRRVGHGCNCNRATVGAVESAGFTVTDLEHGELKKAPPIVRPLVIGSATRA
jgi:ubiquinone/menaquinone biosynthesis C-methylase UbiE